MNASQKYEYLKKEIGSLCTKLHREPKDVEILVVTKNQPSSAVLELYQTGCRNFGENRLPEALLKKEELPSEINWHFIGNLQSNKVAKAIGVFSLIHSVDSFNLAEKISKLSLERRMKTNILIQVNTSGETSKQGLGNADLLCHFAKFKALQGVNIEGLMTMAPLTDDELMIRNCFSELRVLRDRLGLKHLSMGMSGDYKIAIEEGATIVRIGSYLFQA